MTPIRVQPQFAKLGLRVPAWAVFVVGTVIAVALPWSMNQGDRSTYITIGLAVMVTVGLTMMVGFAGQISLGQGAFYLVGAYTAGLLVIHGVPTVLALVLAPVATALVAAIVGVPLLRLQGNYLAFATLALHLMALSIVVAQSGLTGGEIGLQVPGQLNIGISVDGAMLAALVWLLAMCSLFLTRNLITSRVGRGLQAIASGETGAALAGVSVGSYKLRVFMIAAGWAGLAGGLYTFQTQYLSSDSFPILLSVEFLVMAAVGGLGSVSGALVGAVAIVLLQQNVSDLGTNSSLPTTAPQIISLGVYGIILVLVMLYLPRGLLPSAVSVGRRVLGRQPRRGRRTSGRGAEVASEGGHAEQVLATSESSSEADTY